MPPDPDSPSDEPLGSARDRTVGLAVAVALVTLVSAWVASYTVPQPKFGIPHGYGVALWVVYTVSYLVLPVWLWHASVPKRLLMNVWMTLLGVAIAWLFWFTDLVVFLGSIAITAVTLPVVMAVTFNAVVLGAVFVAGITVAEHEVTGALLVIMVAIAVSVTAVGQLIRVVEQLRQTRAELARLAVVAERNRLARDLHDVLGHSLTTIAVKSGLARRLLESDADDRDRAVTELTDAERLARQAMTEVRAVVSRYRASLADELAGACQALDAAGIRAVVPDSAEVVPADLQPAFAYVVREGVTNVMRHSRATVCEVRIGPGWIEVVDNGPVSTDIEPGNGMTGLAERLTVVGGTVTGTAEPGGVGFRLRASVPGRT